LTKIAQIIDLPGDRFRLEYEDTLGRKNSMRLDSLTYDSALREARTFLGINEQDLDADGNTWEMQ
jgi:hypothetical protein